MKKLAKRSFAILITSLLSAQALPVLAQNEVLPVRTTFSQLGFEVSWINDTKTAEIKSNDINVTITPTHDKFIVNGKHLPLTKPIVIENGAMLMAEEDISVIFNMLDQNKKLASTNWQGTTVKDENGNDITELNQGFIGLAKYDDKTSRYEFFDKQTGKTRDDSGVYFVTQDGKKRILISQTKNYNAVVDMKELNATNFLYSRTGKVADKTDGTVFVDHVPYSGNLNFTNSVPTLNTTTGKIETNIPGRDILAKTNWHGTKVLDANGKDVTEFNMNFIGLAKYDNKTNQYEFFDKQTGKPRGDFGYFDVINQNKERAMLSVGMKYATTLEITELNDNKFTYTRKGKDADGKEIVVFVEHEPYKGDFDIKFSF